MDGDGASTSGDVSSPAADEGPLTDPELPQPNASPPTDPTENDVVADFWLFARVLARRHRPPWVVPSAASGHPNTWRNARIFFETRNGYGGGYTWRGDVDADAADAAGADDAYGGFGYGFGFGFGAVPASGVAIACLPETIVGEDEARERGECAVCLDEFVAGDALRTMPCAHGFHERCIFEWLRVSRLCPLCRFALPREEYTSQ